MNVKNEEKMRRKCTWKKSKSSRGGRGGGGGSWDLKASKNSCKPFTWKLTLKEHEAGEENCIKKAKKSEKYINLQEVQHQAFVA